jgi:hypothetical protein
MEFAGTLYCGSNLGDETRRMQLFPATAAPRATFAASISSRLRQVHSFAITRTATTLVGNTGTTSILCAQDSMRDVALPNKNAGFVTRSAPQFHPPTCPDLASPWHNALDAILQSSATQHILVLKR